MASGYLHALYAESLAEWGRPIQLVESGGWLLERHIEPYDDRDAMGCYPLFTCRDWGRLQRDLAALEGKLVSLTVVADPFAATTEAELQAAFPDLMRAYKQHFVIDLGRAPGGCIHPHHLR